MVQQKIKILVTGANGTLGSALCKLFKDKYEVVPLYHKEYDITDKQKIISKLEQEKPNILIHAAALTNVDYCQIHPEEADKVNREGTENLCLACRKIDCKFIYISTDYVFDGKKETAYLETDNTNPLNKYAQSKLEGEKTVQKLLEKYFILRLSWLFGKKDNDFIAEVIKMSKASKEIKIINDKYSIPTYSIDFASSLEYFFDKVNYGIYHITNASPCSWYDFASKIIEYLNLDTKILPIKLVDFNFKAKRPRNSVLDTNKFSQVSGIRLRAWQEALKEYLQECYKN